MTKRDKKNQRTHRSLNTDKNRASGPMSAGTLVHETFKIQKVLLESRDFIIYEALDLHTDEPCLMIELFNAENLERLYPNTLVVKPGREDAHQLAGNDFMYSLAKLKKAGALPHIPAVLDLFLENQSAYAIAQPADVPSLNDYITRYGPMSFVQVQEVLAPVASALARLHQQGLQHSFLNEQTLRADQDGLVVLGFGTQYGREEPAGFESPYLASEQVTAPSYLLNQSDIYALTALTYYMLSGSRIPDVRARLDGQLIEYPAGWPREWISFLEAGLDLDPAQRISTIEDWAEHLQALPESARPGKKVVRKTRPKKRSYRGTIRAGLLLCACGIALAAIAPMFNTQSEEAEHVEEKPGYFSDGKVSAQTLESLQAVEIDTLDFKNCDFADLDSSLLTSNPTIKKLTISSPQNLTSLEFLKNFPGLEELTLAGCGITGDMISQGEIAQMTKMVRLNLADNQLTSLDFINEMASLEWLDLSGNAIESMGAATNLRQLKYVNLAGNQIKVFDTLVTYNPVVLVLNSNPIVKIEDHGQDGMYYDALTLMNTPIFEQSRENYQPLGSINGNLLLLTYAFNDIHVDENEINQPLYVLAYDSFSDNTFVNIHQADQERIESYFAEKPARFIDTQEADAILADLRKNT